MTVRLIKSFDMQDCKHYKRVTVQGCCGRSHKAGLCTIPYEGREDYKTCARQMEWCKYQKTLEEK